MQKPLLRILSCGSVDDGKSTLLGRILYECGALYEEQLELLQKERTLDGHPDYSCLLDGLLAEREQAITIDVAYRSFSTDKRRFLLADAPGHEQYTSNMATGASHADAALLLIDAERARDGLLPQTVRHAAICSLLGIGTIVVAVNKMDACAYDRRVFVNIKRMFYELAAGLDFRAIYCVPVSALLGDNVSHTSSSMPWYHGQTLLDILERLEAPAQSTGAFRLPVQWVARLPEYRAFAGTVLSGSVSVGQKVKILPSGTESRVRKLLAFDAELETAPAEQPVSLVLEDERDVQRGDVICPADSLPEVADQFSANMVWMGKTPLIVGRTYTFRLAACEALATVSEVSSRLDMQTLEQVSAQELHFNEIGTIKISLDRRIPFEPYGTSRDLGAFLLVDRLSGDTLAAGMIQFALRRSHNIHWHHFALNKENFAAQKGQKPMVLWFTGLSAAGKSSLANLCAKALYAEGKHVYLLDGDNLRYGLNRDLGFTEKDRTENIRRASEVAGLMVDAGLIVLASFISPYREDRAAIRDRFTPGEFVEIFVDTPLDLCIARDPKGLYKKALAGELPNFTGVTGPFEPPLDPDLHLDGTKPLEDLVEEIRRFLEQSRG